MHPQMEPVTVRFTPEAMRSIEQAARQNGLSKAQVVRLATDGDLIHYLQNVRIVSPNDAAEIQDGIRELCRETGKASFELHRIGVNIAQITKAVNYMAKRGQSIPDWAWDVSRIRKDLLDIVARYEEASGKVGEALCHILG